MKSIFTALFLLCISLTGFGQSIDNMCNHDSETWLKLVDKCETVCELPKDNWLNNPRGGKPWKAEEKLTFVINGDLSHPRCLENLRALNKLQFILGHIKVIYIHQSENSYPSNLTEFQDVLNRYDIGIPSMMDTLRNISCFNPTAESVTTVISPYGKIMGTVDGWHDIDQLIQLAGEFTDIIMNVYNIKMQPFLGKTPSQKLKTPLLRAPMSIDIDQQNERIFVCDYMANKVLMLTMQGQLLEIIGTGRPFFKDAKIEEAALDGPRAVAFDEFENTLYIADAKNRRIRKVDMNSLEVSTILGNGAIPAEPANKILGIHNAMPYPLDMALDETTLYFSTIDAVWQMDIRTQVAEKISMGDTLNLPIGLSVDSSGRITFCDTPASEFKYINGTDVKMYISTSNGAGYQNGKKGAVMFDHPTGAVFAGGDLIIADQFNHAIRKFSTKKQKAETLSGGAGSGYKNGNLAQAKFNLPADIAKLGDAYYITELGNNVIRKINLIEGSVTTLPISEYDNLSVLYRAPIQELNDGPIVKINKGSNHIEIKIDLGENFQFDPNGKSNVSFVTRNRDALETVDDDPSDGKISFDIDVDQITRPIDVTVDLYMFIKPKSESGRVYFKQTAYMVTLDPSAEMVEGKLPTISINLD